MTRLCRHDKVSLRPKLILEFHRNITIRFIHSPGFNGPDTREIGLLFCFYFPFFFLPLLLSNCLLYSCRLSPFWISARVCALQWKEDNSISCSIGSADRQLEISYVSGGPGSDSLPLNFVSLIIFLFLIFVLSFWSSLMSQCLCFNIDPQKKTQRKTKDTIICVNPLSYISPFICSFEIL